MCVLGDGGGFLSSDFFLRPSLSFLLDRCLFVFALKIFWKMCFSPLVVVVVVDILKLVFVLVQVPLISFFRSFLPSLAMSFTVFSLPCLLHFFISLSLHRSIHSFILLLLLLPSLSLYCLSTLSFCPSWW